MSVETIKSAINRLAKEGFLDAFNDDKLRAAIFSLERKHCEYEAKQQLNAVIRNYQANGNSKAAQIVAEAL